ncbi:MAG: mtgA [Bacteriovoracaceae bacterium]|nr:mtgA [Bacteriovoracaceae bacterium]
MGLDFGVFVGTYFILPDTKKLIQGITLDRIGRDGKLFPFVAGPKNRKFVRLNQIPKSLQTAVLSLEDARFYQHLGIDWVELKIAISTNIEDGKKLRGASSISQQLVKNLYLFSERSFRRKILEALITIKLENTLTKNQILELYLNSIDWGRGLLGISDATIYYFKKNPDELNLKESVFLAAIIPNPSRFGKFTEDKIPKRFVRTQMMRALQEMYRAGNIKFNDFEEVMENPYKFNEDEF